MEGTIKFFNKNKGYGFIATDVGQDIFFHICEVKHGTTPEQNIKVDFEVTKNNKGLFAKNVRGR